MFNPEEATEVRKTIHKKNMDENEINGSEPIVYSEVVFLFEKFLERKNLRLKNLREDHEKYAKLDGLLCQKIVEYGSHRSAFRNVFNRHGYITSQIWGVK